MGEEKSLTEAVKYDQTKPRFDLLPVQPITEIVEVFTFGAQKYSDRNYLGLRWSRVAAAGMRHFFAWLRGEELDAETGKSHLAHLGCCVLMLMEMQYWQKGTDDRYRGGDE